MTGVKRIDQNILHPLARDLPVLVAREVGKGFKVALDFGLSFKSACGVAFERLTHDGRQWLVGFD